MRRSVRLTKFLTLIVVTAFLAGCPWPPPHRPHPYYSGPPAPEQAGPPISSVLRPIDRTFVMEIQDHTPFGIYSLPVTQDLMYSKGYDEVRQNADADFSVNLTFTVDFQENPDARAGHALGGALFGAATGAIIGGAVSGRPGLGAGIGAASGAVLGLAAPAHTGVLRIDMNIVNFKEGLSYQRSVTLDLTRIPPPGVHRLADDEVYRMLQTVPRR